MIEKNSSTPNQKNGFSMFFGWCVVLILTVTVFALGLLAVSITERRAESVVRVPLKEIPLVEMNAEVWGQNYPRQYDSWAKTKDTSFIDSKYGGSGHRDYLEETPANVILFAGYGFGKDYCQARGHWYSVNDVTKTLRVNASTPASCWYCKSPDVPRLIGQWGSEKFASFKFDELKNEITHSIGCYDCHEENTMKLRVLRPAVRDGLAAMGQDVETFSHQEMRSVSCAQCHSTYYFKTESNLVTFPWSKGTSAENIEQYYREDGFSDWTHPISRVNMIKVRHPDYEIFKTGVHAFQGLACADCHMPYKTEGAEKFSDHHLRSPLADISNTCTVCHRWSETEIRERVYSIQDKIREGRDRAERVLAFAHFDIAACMEAGADDRELATVREELRYAQFHWDFIAAANGMGFHSPQESQRILTTAIDRGAEVRRQCAQILARHDHTGNVVYPDFSTKEKAQAITKLFVDKTPVSLLKKTTPD